MSFENINVGSCRKKIAVVFPKDSESLFNNKKSTFGGATVQLYNYALEMAKYHDVYCLVGETEISDNERFNSLNILFTFSKNDGYLKRIVKFHKTLRSIGPDVVIQRGLTRISTFLALYCIIFKISYVFMFAHDREARGRFQRSNRFNQLYPLLLCWARYLVVQNDFQQGSIPGIFKKKTFKIPSGYEIEKDFSFEKKGVLWVSRLEPWKRPELCIELAMKNPDIPFTMIAPIDPNDAEYGESIHKMAKNIRNIRIIDFVCFTDIDKYFRSARVFLNTSEEEGFPNTFIQACKNRTPIVSLNVNPDGFISRFSAGIFCDGNFDKMNDALVDICRNDSLFEKYSNMAYDYVLRHHSIKTNAARLSNLIMSV
ncbi:MAG TPA: glycosyltransferase family 4 protein [Spirochaetota bacterium]|nr:glycosyltransferase family 4 protein [Spirochaetota bacterium]HOR45261.1 glycosyltransferase family 4 protein [Spirochaetota bacterium]HPK57481.1 glycosyltransferase family 4 protein [Spirochaetota bacterium]